MSDLHLNVCWNTGLILHGGDCLRCPLVIALVPLKCSVEIYNFLIGCPLPKRKCLGALVLSKTKHTALGIYSNNMNNCAFLYSAHVRHSVTLLALKQTVFPARCGTTFELWDLILIAPCNILHGAMAHFAADRTRNTGANPFSFW